MTCMFELMTLQGGLVDLYLVEDNDDRLGEM
jgi:hypothetical protein